MTAAPPPSVETLAVQMAGLQRLLDERFQSQQRAEDLAGRTLDAWKTTTNEMRGMLNDTFSRLLTKEEYNARYQSLESKSSELERRIALLEGNRAGQSDLWVRIGVLATIVVVLANFIKDFLVHS